MSKKSEKGGISVTITKDERRINHWIRGGVTGGFTFSAKVFDEGSVYGIDNGRVSKLDIRKDGKILVNYDRGWDVKPGTPEVKAVYKNVMAAMNALDKVTEVEPKDLLGKIEENKRKVSHNQKSSETREKPRGDELC